MNRRVPRIGVVIIPNDPFWVQVENFIIQQLGPSLVPLDTEDIPSRPLTLEEQADVLDRLIALDLDALVCGTLPRTLFMNIINYGLPVVSLDEIEDLYEVQAELPGLTSLRSLEKTGALSGEFLAAQMHGAGRILCIKGEAGLMDFNASRMAGLERALQPYPGITIDTISTSWIYEQALLDLERKFARMEVGNAFGIASGIANGNAAGIYAAGGHTAGSYAAIYGLSDSIALAARDARRKLGLSNDQTLIVGTNGDPLALAAVADGSLAATVSIPTKEFAGQAAALALQAAAGKVLPRHYGFTPTLVTKANVAEESRQKLIDIAGMPSRLVGVNRQAEQSRLKQLEVSVAVSRSVSSLRERGQLIGEAARLISANYSYDQVLFYGWSEADQTFHLEYPQDAAGAAAQADKRLALNQSGLLGEALKRNKPIFILDITHSRRFTPEAASPDDLSRGVLPVCFGERTLGCLDLRSQQPARLKRQDLLGLQALAEQLGVAIRNSELYSEAVAARLAAEKANQLKTRLLANVSHELRAPLNVIMGYTRVALNDPNPYQAELPPQLYTDLEHVYASGEHLLRLINDLLDLSRAEIGELELFPETIATRSFLEDVFHNQARIYTEGDAHKITWELQLPARLPMIQADPVRLRQVLLNILVNARKFTREGKITLGAEIFPPHLHLWVKDTGPGIPFDEQELIFQPFVTIEHSDRRPEGVGLGLSITRRLVALHGGTLTLDSAPGRGSTFHIFLPLPTLAGRPSQLPEGETRQTLLLLSSRDELPGAVLALNQHSGWQVRRIRPGDDLNAVLAETRPAMLAWEMNQDDRRDWELIHQLRDHPQASLLPFMVYGPDPPGSGTTPGGLTGLFTKPVNGQKLIDTLTVLRPADTSGPILIVDDDPESRQRYKILVEKALPGLEVCMACDGAEALKLLACAAPCLVLLDLMMPGVDGFEVLSQIRAEPRTHSVPVIILSGKILTAEDIHRLDYTRVAFQSKDILSPEELQGCLRRVFENAESLPQPTSKIVKQVLSRIQQSYPQPLSRADLAAGVCVTESYLSKIFRQEVGISPREYLTRYRVNVAKELLAETDESITSLARRVGFEDSAYFSRVFHNYTGMSPQSWRKMA